MKSILYTNTRITNRNNLDIKGTLSFDFHNNIISEVIMINNISLNGLQIVFSNNYFLYTILEINEKNDFIFDIEFNLHTYSIKIKCTINWIKIIDIGEKSFYVLLGINYERNNFIENKQNLISLLVDINMTNFYLGKIENIEESLIG
ncbi:MAG: hypothetical protein A2015_03790 [Spirochaetes bacterium GWF1_31_7]|nr:MAG: hypothetical protein A2Y30_06335 [Spirochaetes bacterium GWE1_32_154]OHD48832.1 MAG: hypothetical protein A2015_03790 [Spirochaetes bacterium GWF1_31_7]OHD78030.1 MAG: hypothetical protein A2355_18200 [Spirochaetes bacterium RIFOXYB1_FULL_32_8]HBD92648.1 hypothetical protein [Spirochaetia bacterium]HBI36867.1 hypothetical protein [Spirochaetia bacterium]